MIEKLSKKQVKKMQLCREKWIKIGKNTDRLNYDKTIDIVNDFQEKILLTKKTPVVIFNNPIEAWYATWFASNGEKINNLKNKVEEAFDKNVKVPKPVYPYQDGSFSSALFSFYDFFINEIKIDISEDLKEKFEIWKRTSDLGLLYPLKNVCIVSEKPTCILTNESNNLHCENGPAIKYDGRGDFEIYSLNGVSVPKWLVMTPEEDLSLEDYHKIKNADVRTEFVRKFGVERMLEGFGQKIDSFKNYDEEWWNKSQYELWDMQKVFDGVNYAPHLKMMNQTTKIWHVEAVSPSCRNLQDAIKERFGGKDFKIKSIA